VHADPDDDPKVEHQDEEVEGGEEIHRGHSVFKFFIDGLFACQNGCDGFEVRRACQSDRRP
jgi:hypothetical protein